jgi:8-amino-7-oxononanoate synthase
VRGRPGLDFTSALFLGMRHDHRSLPGWTSLTTGVPAAWREPSTSRLLGSTIARAQGIESAFVARSALHALTDAMTVLPRAGDIVAIDEAVYPIAATASLIAKGRGVTVRRYPHHRPAAPTANSTRRVIYVTDGWCQGCNRPAPLGQLQALAQRGNGIVVVDDSLACGVLGKRCDADSFGDGTGSPRWMGLDHDRLLWIASLAKGYGAALAVATGDTETIGKLTHDGSRQYSSPPTSADLTAAAAAVRDRHELGRRRKILHDHVTFVRDALASAGLTVIGLPFPLVGIMFASQAEALRWCARLQSARIHLLVQRPRCRRGALLTAVLRSEHSTRDIERLVATICRLTDRDEAAS